MTRNYITFAIIVAASLWSAGLASAQQEGFTISTPSGGDCIRVPLSGSWSGRTCTLPGFNLRQNQALNIRSRALVRVTGQVVNQGTIAVGENGELEFRSTVVNYGALVIVPAPGFASPGVSNHGNLQNFGTIFNAKRGNSGGIFNNFGTIRNSKEIRNNGFFHNGGLIDNVGSGFFQNSGGGGTLENRGTINGRVL